MVKFGGYFTMKKLKEVMFIYEDGTADCITDDRAALLFQSRANTSGLLSGLEEYVIPVVKQDEVE